jgi:hypothetical protein
MADISTILGATSFKNYIEFHRAMRTPALRKLISKSQSFAVIEACERFFPNDFELRQRTPKGTIYIYVDEDLEYVVDQRGDIKRAYEGKHLENKC